MVVSPWGVVAAATGDESDVVFAEIDLGEVSLHFGRASRGCSSSGDGGGGGVVAVVLVVPVVVPAAALDAVVLASMPCGGV